MQRIVSAGAAVALLAGCQLGYFIREPRPSPPPRTFSASPPPDSRDSGEDRELLERGERVPSVPPDTGAQPSAPNRVETHIYYVPTCSCWYCCRYRSTWLYPTTYWGVTWSRRGWGWGWGVGWGW